MDSSKSAKSFGVMETDVIQDKNYCAAMVPTQDNFEKFAKGRRVSARHDLAKQLAGFQIYHAK